MRPFSTFFSITVLAGVFAPLSFAASATGTWKGSFVLPNQQQRLPFVARLMQSGGKVTGTLDGLNGAPDVHITDGTVKGDVVTFYGVRQFRGQGMKFKYVARMAGDNELDFDIARAGVKDDHPVHIVTKRSQ